MENFTYLKENDLISGGYINIPIVLYNSPSYTGITNDAILLYGVLRSNSKFSAENGLLDNMGRLYVIAPLSYIMKTIRCSKNTARKLLEQLEKYLLIEFIEDKDTKKIRYLYLGEVKEDNIKEREATKNKKRKKIVDKVLEKKKDSIKKSDYKKLEKEADIIKKSTDNRLEREPGIIKKSTNKRLEKEPDGIKKSTNKGFKKVTDGIKKSTSIGSNYEPSRGQNLNPNKNIYKNTYKKGMYQEVREESYPYYKEFDFED